MQGAAFFMAAAGLMAMLVSAGPCRAWRTVLRAGVPKQSKPGKCETKYDGKSQDNHAQLGHIFIFVLTLTTVFILFSASAAAGVISLKCSGHRYLY